MRAPTNEAQRTALETLKLSLGVALDVLNSPGNNMQPGQLLSNVRAALRVFEKAYRS